MLRRDFIRRSAAAAAGAAAGVTLPADGLATAVGDAQVKWSKAPCRFCGTGCGVNVAVKDNRVIATRATRRPR